MDFQLIEDHPWITAAAVLVGGLVLYLILRGRGSSASSSPSGVTYYPAQQGTDPTAAALQANDTQAQTYLAGLNVQSATQIQLAGIQAGVAGLTVTAQQDVTNKQTAAQLALGLGTLQAQVDITAIQAQSELDAINAIARAYGAGSGSSGSSGPVGVGSGIVSTPTTITQPTTQITPPVPVYLPPGGAPPGGNTTDTGSYPLPQIGGPVITGGTPLEPPASFIPVGAWPDVNVVNSNTLQSVEQENATVAANKINNFNACMRDAALSPTPAFVAQQQSQCHVDYGM
jgi:hypothetical protein